MAGRWFESGNVVAVTGVDQQLEWVTEVVSAVRSY